jgi:O-antigen ligase
MRTRTIALLHGALFTLVITGVLPRSVVPFWTLALCLWAAVVPPRQSAAFFVFAIPLFVAIPITADFDNFNMWRPLAIVVFLKWFFTTQSFASAHRTVRAWLRRPLGWPVATSFIILFTLGLLSAFVAADWQAALRRLVLWANVILVPVVVYSLVKDDARWRHTFVRAVAWSAALVTAVAFVQLASTYLMDVYRFMALWGEGVQLRQYGALWSRIAVTMGNTWLAYYGPQLSLRIFSLFPDSHSFPVYLVLALSGAVALGFRPVVRRLDEHGIRLRDLLRTRGALFVVWVPLGLLAVILSGTRGIWAASLGLPLVYLAVRWWMRRSQAPTDRRTLWSYLALWLSVYFLLFAIAWPVFVSPQFLLLGGDRNLLGNRFRSIVDWGETSNRARLDIWRATGQSIAAHPWLGVGVGNYPTVLSQHVILAKAGSSAHNLYLHMAAEMGIGAFVVTVALFGLAFRSSYRLLVRDGDTLVASAAGWLVFAVPWVAAYLLTDAALLDERALLLFASLLAFVRGADSSA